jgi:hypothetical protein
VEAEGGFEEEGQGLEGLSLCFVDSSGPCCMCSSQCFGVGTNKLQLLGPIRGNECFVVTQAQAWHQQV